ncbi:putative ubiquitin carboxyl-terminal hydrolase [Babesia divergens]|uniref:Ubiquitin carboxyl-terminal hydrolase n=1 Tax=Babesia divergens TaxID=32595 RepID=A0AAD9GAC0_BABDI|nr:putative ubiquitin carboxyl-terminal hydrolase [Babesia divergens]
MESKQIAHLAQTLGLKPPQHDTIVHKAECVYSTDTEKSPNGLYINLKTFESFGHDMISFDRAGKDALYLHVRKELVPVVADSLHEDGTPDNLDGSNEIVYKPKKVSEEVSHYEVCSTLLKEPVPLDMLPASAAEICRAIIDSAGFDFKTDEFVWKEYMEESKYAKHLIQIEAPPVINYEDLSCNRCGSTSNLWLNLSDGYVGCGRRNFDAGGCLDGEEGAAIQHYHDTGGVYPLAVKVGTITATSGDVYSYAPDEDAVVLDPYLAEHLAHFGLDVKSLYKTEKSTLQLQIEQNERHNWSEMNGIDGEVVYGPGLVGLDNSGNTCYLNSAIQLLAAVDELASYFVSHYSDIAENLPADVNPHDDVLLQFAKIVRSLVTDRVINQQLELVKRYQVACQEAGVEYVEPEQYKNFSVKPSMLKYSIGKLKKQFSTNEQQDAEEFLSCFINLLDEISPEIKRRCKTPLTMKDMFFFQTRQSIVCDSLKKITYNDSETHMISLPLFSGDKSEEGLDDNEEVLLTECFKNWAQDQDIDYFENDTAHQAVIKNTFLTLPNYLIVSLQRFFLMPNCTVKKMGNPISVPTEGIVLEAYSEEDNTGYKVEHNTREAKKAKTHVNSELFKTLLAMGFKEKLCRLACEKSDSSNVDECVNWILSNMDTVSEESSVGDKNSADVAANVSLLMDLGYPREQASKAAEVCGNDIAAAVDWIATNELSSKNGTTKRATYRPVGIISHIGSNINTGHYVCHINRNNQWYTFNDSKVLRSDSISAANGYIYLLKRCDGVEGQSAEHTT